MKHLPTLFSIVIILGSSDPAPAKTAPPGEPTPPHALRAPNPQESPESSKTAPKSSNPDLLVHLKFDDGAAADASGHQHSGVVQGKVAWEAGKAGKAASFDGSGGHIEIPSADDLDKVNEGNYTIAAWFKPANAPPGQEDANNANYGIVNRTGWHEGLRYTNEKKFVMEHWLAGDKPEEPKWTGAGTWEDTFEPGTWYHVVGVVDRAAGEVRLYVNGELKNTSENFGANAKAREYGKITWKIGMAAPGAEKWAWPAKGATGDVRFYKKALSEAEVEALYKESSK